MDGKEPAGMHPELNDLATVDRYVRTVSDTIHDPCALATGVRLGMDQMGLIRNVGAEPDDVPGEAGGWRVVVTVRLTSSGCEYFFAFKENLEARLARHPRVSEVRVEWDPVLDWTPEEMTEQARELLERRRNELRGAVTALPMSR